ncbi:MAG: Unknown protein [uncultured Campylobacterales bacterium]|uniref:Transporter n=1 Tax=uncultured Campylobacterales bacterium TaxID=352960 RepID=A0A6S6SLX2_9BACT|nr:MAG: Unknown protein [uncultured Campylobacterales bacterium]
MMKIFLSGLSLIVPVGIICYVLLWFLNTTEKVFRDMLLTFFPHDFYIVGMGFVFGIVLIYLVGLSLKFWFVKKLRYLVEELIDRTPILSSLYGGMKDFFRFFSNLKNKDRKIVVIVNFKNIETKMVGFVTLETLNSFDSLDLKDSVMVYLQMSYQMGGYSIVVPKSSITHIDLGIEEAFRLVMTAGISMDEEKE